MIIGREGEQPFEIDQKHTSVSRQHAELLIDGERWTLRNLNVENYTYVRDDFTGSLIHIEQKQITPLTFIVLGDKTARGYCFYARQIQKPTDGYRKEFKLIKRKYEEYEKRKALLNNRIKILQYCIPIGVTLFATVGLTIIFGMKIGAIGILGVLSGLFSRAMPELFSKQKKEIEDFYQSFCHCPNPECRKPTPLNSNEISAMRCSSCGAM